MKHLSRCKEVAGPNTSLKNTVVLEQSENYAEFRKKYDGFKCFISFSEYLRRNAK